MDIAYGKFDKYCLINFFSISGDRAKGNPEAMTSSYISFPAECDMAEECTSALPHQLPRLLLPLHIKKLREFFTVRLNSTCKHQNIKIKHLNILD